jgi:hypothetical protein
MEQEEVEGLFLKIEDKHYNTSVNILEEIIKEVENYGNK